MKHWGAVFCGFMLLASGVGFEGLQREATGADKYPSKPITFIIPYEAGSGGDLITRPLVEGASKKLGVPIVVINKPGASGTVGLKDILDAKPDGYTIGQHSALDANKLQGLFPKGQRDVEMIGTYQCDPGIIACYAKKPWKTIQEVIEFAKGHPEQVSAATSSKGAIWWLAAMAFQEAVGIKLNILPQPGAGGMAATQAAGGHADLGFIGIPEGKTLIDSGNLRFLAVIGPNRVAGKYNYAPTMKEVGYDVTVMSLRCVLGPKGMPKPVVEKLTQVFGEVAQSKEYKDFLVSQNSISLWLPGEQGVKAFDERGKIFYPLLQRAGLLKEAK